MKQILQDLKSGKTVLEDVPAPSASTNGLLTRTAVTLVSAGTERMLVDFGKSNLIQKARSHPDKVQQAFAKVHTDGVMPTVAPVRHKLDTQTPSGHRHRTAPPRPVAQGGSHGDAVLRR